MLTASRRLRRIARCAGLAVACAALALPALAQWKWRDSRGQIHVSDTPPPREVPEKDVLQRPDVATRKGPTATTPAAAAAPASAASGAAPAKPPVTVDSELEQRKRQAEQDKAARQKAEDDRAAALRRDNCKRARDHLAVLESGQRIARVKPDGTQEVMDDEQRAKEARLTRETITANCR